MKHSKTAPLMLLLSLLCASSFAQVQRVGLSVGNFTLPGHGVKTANGYCLDPHLDAPEKPTTYDNLLEGSGRAVVRVNNGTPIPLETALGKIIGVETVWNGRHEGPVLEVRFKNLTSDSVRVSFTDAVAFGPRPAAVNKRQLAAVKAGGTKEDVWAPAKYERILSALGYYDGPPDGLTDAALVGALNRFQDDVGVARSAMLNDVTRQKLLERQKDLSSKFVRLGFKERDLARSVSKYEESNGLPKTGRVTPRLAKSLSDDVATLTLLAGKIPPRAGMSGLPGRRRLLGVETTLESRTSLVSVNDDFELWRTTHTDSLHVERFRGPFALDAYAVIQAGNVSRLLDDPGTVVVNFLPVTKEGKASGVAFTSAGKTNFEYAHAHDGTMKSAQLEDAIAMLKKRQKHVKIVVLRSPFEGHPDLIKTMAKAEEAANVSIPAALTQAVSLRRTYGRDADVYIANDVGRGGAHLRSLPSVSPSAAIKVFVDGKYFRDYGTVGNLTEVLEDAGVTRVEVEALSAGTGTAGKPEIALFVSHNTKAARDRILELARGGHLKGSIVVMAICGEGGEIAYNANLLAESGAKAVLFYDQKINPVAVQAVLENMCTLLQKGVDGPSMQRLWLDAIDLAMTKKPDLRDDITALRGAVMQLSRIIIPSTSALEVAA